MLSLLITVLGHFEGSLLFEWSMLIFLLLFLLWLIYIFLDFLSSGLFLYFLNLLFGELCEMFISIMFDFFVFGSFLLFRHVIIITIYSNWMSRSSRQIGVPKELVRDGSSLSTYTHRRNGSIEGRNFSQLVELGRKYYGRN